MKFDDDQYWDQREDILITVTLWVVKECYSTLDKDHELFVASIK